MDNYASQGYMRTAHGWVSLLNPTVDMIYLDDIVSAAARIRRFNGHSNITLLEHSIRVHDLVQLLHPHDHGHNLPRILRAALMHDAHEAYVTDVPSPLKQAMRTWSDRTSSDYDQLEDQMARCVADQFDFDIPLHPHIKEADTIALAVEADMTWGRGTAEEWGLDPIDDDVYMYAHQPMTDFVGRLEDTYAAEASTVKYELVPDADGMVYLPAPTAPSPVPAPQIESTPLAQLAFEGRVAL